MFAMPEANCVFPECVVARHHVGAGIFKLLTRKADNSNSGKRKISRSGQSFERKSATKKCLYL